MNDYYNSKAMNTQNEKMEEVKEMKVRNGLVRLVKSMSQGCIKSEFGRNQGRTNAQPRPYQRPINSVFCHNFNTRHLAAVFALLVMMGMGVAAWGQTNNNVTWGTWWVNTGDLYDATRGKYMDMNTTQAPVDDSNSLSNCALCNYTHRVSLTQGSGNEKNRQGYITFKAPLGCTITISLTGNFTGGHFVDGDGEHYDKLYVSKGATTNTLNAPGHLEWYNGSSQNGNTMTSDPGGYLTVYFENGAPGNGSGHCGFQFTVQCAGCDPTSACNSTINHNQTKTINLDCHKTYCFFDSGGEDGDYDNNENYTLTLRSTGNQPITINFSQFVTQSSNGCDNNRDYMSIYNGSIDNLIVQGQTNCNSRRIEICQDYTANSGTMIIVWRSNGNTTAAGWRAIITTTCPPCPAPTNLTVTTVSNTSAHVSWTGDASAVSYTVRYRVAGGAWTTLPTTTLTEANITGLDPETTYEIQVQANCDDDATSDWTSTTYYNSAYAAELVSIDYGSGTWCKGSTRPVTVSFRNAGTQTWYNDGFTTSTGCNSDPHHRTFLSYTWGSVNDFSGRTPLGRDVAPGDTVTFTLNITAEASGNQNLLLKFRRSECDWFSTQIDGAPFSIPITISADEAPTIAVDKVACLNGSTQVVLTACVSNTTSCSWSCDAGTEGTQSGGYHRTYTVTPRAVHNLYKVTVGSCTNTIAFDLPIGTISVSPTTTDCNGHANLTATGNDGAIYNWYNSNGDTLSSSNPYSVTLTHDSTFLVNASFEQPDRVMVFDTTGRYTVTIPAGITSVKLEVWGAQGGAGLYRGNTDRSAGNGGYSVGTLSNPSGTLYVFVGGSGSRATQNNNANGGFNGGGQSSRSTDGRYLGGSGGGATHIATTDGELSSLTTTDQINSVLVVAGGGGGGSEYENGGSGGGQNGIAAGNNNGSGKGGTDAGGGNGGPNASAGVFGAGGAATTSDYGAGGGGGGWYGGGGGGDQRHGTYTYGHGGGGGSGYIKDELSDKQSINGATQMPNPYGSTMIGKTGNGYARLTFYGQVCTSPNTTVNVTTAALDAEIQITNP